MKINFFTLIIFVFVFNQKLSAQRSGTKHYKSVAQITGESPDTCLLTCIVVDTYTCPPCPPGMQCKPCIGDHVLVSDEASDKKKTLTVLAKDPEQYIKEKKYTFLIKLHKDGKKQVFEAVLIKEKK